MNKIFTLFTFLCLFGMTAFAQDEDLETLVFLDANGEVVANGSTLTFDNVVLDDYDVPSVSTGLQVKNTTDKDVYCTILTTVSKMDSGEFEICFPANCHMIKKTESYEDATPSLYEKNKLAPTNTKWMPEQEEYGECVAKLQLKIYKKNGVTGQYSLKAYGPAVTCNFIYSEETAIKNVESAANNAFFNLAGQPVGADYKGIVISGGKKMLRK